MVKPWMKRLLGANGAYYLGTLLQIIVYRAPDMTMCFDDREFRGYTWMVVVGNSETSAGGSMCLSPGARLDDGELNISIFPSQSKLKMVTKLMPKIATGEHVNDASISYFPGRRIAIDSNPSAFLELDGDLFGTTPATFTVCPGALQVMTPEE
jgi:diacylglycerol kinase family enzyme